MRAEHSEHRKTGELRPSVRPILYIGIHKPHLASQLPRAMVSLNVLLNRKSDFLVNDWMLDSGAFTRIMSGQGHLPLGEYAGQITRWSSCGTLKAAVCQDFMCEPVALASTGLDVEAHQTLTTQNYLDLRAQVHHVYIMPVIQGWLPSEYAQHTRDLSPHLPDGTWVGVGSVCKRQKVKGIMSRILTSILDVRPDLRLHGFGVKATALQLADVASRFYSVDSMAWSYAGRFKDHRANDVSMALEWAQRIEGMTPQASQMSMGVD